MEDSGLLAFAAFLLWSLYNSGYELFAREKPQIIDGSIFSENPQPFSALQTLPLAFVTMTAEGTDSKFCKYYLGIPRGDSSDLDSLIRYEMEKCTPEYFSGYPIGTFESILSSLYCLPRNIEFTVSFSSFSVVGVCTQEDSGEDFFTKTPYSLILFPNYGLTLQNYSSPVQKYLGVDLEFLKSGKLITPSWSISYNNITTDAGWLFPSEKVEHHTELSYDNIKEIDFGVQNVAVILYTFQVSKKEIFYSRSYKRIQNVLAEVGGTANVVFTIFALLVTPYARIKFSEAFVNELFEIEKERLHKAKTMKRSRSKNDIDQQATNLKISSKKAQTIELVRSQSLQRLKQSLKKSQKLANVKDVPIITDKKSRLHSSPNRQNSKNLNKFSQLSDDESLLFVKNREKKPFSMSKCEINASSLQVLKIPDKNINAEAIQLESPLQSQKSVQISPESSHQNEIIQLEDVVNLWENNSANPGNLSIEIKQKGQDFEAQCLSESKLSPINLEGDKKEEKFIEEKPEAKDQNKDDPELKKIDKEGKKKFPDKYRILKLLNMSLIQPRKVKKRPKVISISVFEYVKSFIWKSRSLKEKMAILHEGLNALDNILNIFVLLKKVRDIDKMKSLLFDEEQLELFEQLSPPELNNEQAEV